MHSTRITAIALAALVAVSAAACGDDDDSDDAVTTTTSPAETTTTVTAVADGLRPFPEVTAPLPEPGEQPGDGEHAVEIRAVDLDARTLTVDVIEFLTGEAADEAAGEEGAPNDYFARNVEESAVTVAVAEDVIVTVVAFEPEGPVTNRSASFADVNADGVPTPYWWVTVEDGVIVAIHQQYVP